MDVPSTAAEGLPLRFAIIGCAAGIVPTHLRALAELPGAQIVGMSDVVADRGAARAAESGCPFFTDHHDMLDQLRPDVAVICAPHPFHASIALDCFEAGAHVLAEKPIAVEVAEADQMISAAQQAGRLLAVNFQQRFRPAIKHARAFINEGRLGELVRVLCVEPWFRTATYYRSATWRGTWRGEGGGVLMNQAPHTLDLLCYLAGTPVKVWGWTRALRHAIETEDTAQAMLEYENGAPGYLHINTVEAGARQRLQIVGDRAALNLSGGELTIYHFEPSLREHMLNSPELFSGPNVRAEPIALPEGGGDHGAVYRDLQQAIAQGRQPLANGQEALMSLELANAVTLSSYSERPVRLPLDRAEYSALLTDLKAAKR